MPNQPNLALTDELLNKLFYIGEDKKLYRKTIEHMGFCGVTSWNSLALHAKPVEVDHLSLKVAGLNTYRTRFICDAVQMSVENAYAKQKKAALRAIETNQGKAVKAKHVDNPHNLENAAKKTKNMAVLNREIAKFIKSTSEVEQKLKLTVSEVLAQARKTSNCRETYLAALKAGAYRV